MLFSGSPRAHKTLRLDIGRGALEGLTQAGWQSLTLLILIEVFLKPAGDKGEMAQALMFGAGFFGMVLAVFYTSAAGRWRADKSAWAAWPSFFAAAALGLSAAMPSAWTFVAAVGIGHMLLPLRIPFLTEIYHENYPARRRGTYHSMSLAAAQLTTVVFSYLAGKWLTADLEAWRWIMLIIAAGAAASGLLVGRIPSSPPRTERGAGLLTAFKWAWKDPVFGYLLAVWFIFGFANLWIMPIRISYLAGDLGLSPAAVAMLAAVIPEAARLVFLPLWAYLFDRMNFIVMRMLLNSFFAVGIWIFFTAETATGIALGALLHGIGFAGGRLAWALWVTKMVPQERSAQYMSVHLALTGVRGTFGPMLGFWTLGYIMRAGGGHAHLAAISCGLFILSILLLVPVIKHGRREE
ncbi:MAG: MFS transporter [Elusimicrobiota bacterium]